MNWVLLAGSVLGFIAMAMGAYTEHGLRSVITTEMYDSLSMALRINLMHAILLAAIGLSLYTTLKTTLMRRLKKTAGVLVLATVLFSFSIYLAAITQNEIFLKITPLGGILAMLAWLLLFWVALSKNEDRPANKDFYYFRKPGT